jgi:hypothetical protein
MAWAAPKYSPSEIKKAGKWLRSIFDGTFVINADDPDETERNLNVIGNWRTCHSYPLLSMRMTLTTRAKQIDKRSIIAQRLKRLPSMGIKLVRNPQMDLTQMQDIGGCRAVVRNVRAVRRVVRAYEDAVARSPNRGAEFVKKYDYIQAPKADGYRSIHFVYKYRSSSRKHSIWNGQRIEIQIRSRWQHAWATAVETVDTFAKQALKVGGGAEGWRRFFLLMSNAIAIFENQPECPGCPTNYLELKKEVRAFVKREKVIALLRGWSEAMTVLPTATGDRGAVYLLYLDPGEDRVKITGFSTIQEAKASDIYLSTEKAIQEQGQASQAVLVSTSSLQALRSAFPNYFADTRVFLDLVEIVTRR